MPADENKPITQRDLREALDGAVETIAAEFSILHGEIKALAQNTERRLDRVSDTLGTLESRIGVVTKWANTFDRDNAALNASFYKQ